MLYRLSLRYGWRGLWLMLMGVMWIAFGLGVMIQPNIPRSWVLYEYLPPLAQAAGWWLTGLIAVWAGLKGPARDDSMGHVALYLMPAVRLISFVFSWLIYLGSLVAQDLGWKGHTIGFAEGWFIAAVWCLIQLMLAIAASWPNPEPPLPKPPADAADKGWL